MRTHALIPGQVQHLPVAIVQLESHSYTHTHITHTHTHAYNICPSAVISAMMNVTKAAEKTMHAYIHAKITNVI